jgi:hypothetical protein
MSKKSAASQQLTESKSAAEAVGQEASKRELIDNGSDKRYVRRDEQGQFKESDDVGRSLAQDRRRKAKTVAKSGQGDKGDHKKAP